MAKQSRRPVARVCAIAALVPLTLLPTEAATARVTCAGVPATIVGTSANDVLVGTRGRDVIAGLDGSDTLSGLGGADLICGGYGADTLSGGNGDDRLLGGPGLYKDDRDGPHLLNDTLRGGPGDDRLVGGADPRKLPAPIPDVVDYSNAVRGMQVDLTLGTAQGQGMDTLATQAWYVKGSDHDDVLLGSVYADHLSGGRGADRIAGRAGADVISADVLGPGDDGAADIVRGQRGPDHLMASGGPDILLGGPGNDEIADWGASADRIAGHGGNDWVIDYLVDAPDQLIQGGPGENRLDLRTRDVSSGVMDLGSGVTTLSRTPPVDVAISGFTTVRLPDGDWTVYGTAADEYFWETLVGPRTIYARGGRDYLGGSNDDDYLNGGRGRDRALPERGVDTCVSVEQVIGAECER